MPPCEAEGARSPGILLNFAALPRACADPTMYSVHSDPFDGHAQVKLKTGNKFLRLYCIFESC